MKLLFGFGRLLKAKPFLGICILLLGTMLTYRELYHREEAQAMETALAQADAEAEARELAAERRYQHMQQQAERLEQRNQELARRNSLAQSSLTEIARIYEAADELVEAKLQQIERLKAEHAALRDRVPDDVVRVFQQHPAEDNGDSAGVHRGTGPR